MRNRVLRYLAICTIGLAPVACTNDQSVISSATESHEQLEPAIITDTDLASYMQQIGDRIVTSARQVIDEDRELRDRVHRQDPAWMFNDVQFHLVANNETLNAFTTGGTHVYLYSKLFDECKTEDEFAAVVAHEFAHIVGRHVSRGTTRQYGILGAAALAGIGGYALGGDNREELAMALGGGTLAAGQFLGMGYTREDESEADQLGFQFYCNAGYDPDQFGGFFQTLIDQGLDGESEATSDHPLLKNRVAAAKEWAAEWKSDHPNWQSLRQPAIASGSQFDRYQSRATQIARDMPQDRSLEAAELMFNAFPSCVSPTPQESQAEARQELTDLVEDQKTSAAPAANANNNAGSNVSEGRRRTRAQRARDAQRNAK